MKFLTKPFVIATVCILLIGCASIVSKSVYPLAVNTEPSGILVVIKNENGMEVFSGRSPAVVELAAGAKFFKRAFYTVTVSAEGYEEKTLPVNFTIDGWYFGNLLLGGVIGMLIVDPATGAMYKLDQELINISLVRSDTGDVPLLKVYDLAQYTRRMERTSGEG